MFPDGGNLDADGAPGKKDSDGGNGSEESRRSKNDEEAEDDLDGLDNGSDGGSDRSSSGHDPAGDGNDGSGSSDGDDDEDDVGGGDGNDEDEDGDEDGDEEEESGGPQPGEEEEAAEDRPEVQVAAAADAQAAPQVAPHQGNWLSYENLMSETYLAKSKEVYLTAYRDFELYLKSEGQFEQGVAPTETMLLNYFRYLKVKKHWQPTTIWSQYSRLNGVMKRRFKFSLKIYPCITDLLKSYEVGHRVKKANVFTPQQA
jgi:hypothetical protein